jgi:hypothetical protein
MAQDVLIGGANLDINGNVKTTLPLNATYSGYARPLSEVDAGLVAGTVVTLKAGEVSEDFRLRTELDTILDSHVFNEIAQYTGKHNYNNQTMINTWSGNAMNTNGSGITTINSGTRFQTYQHFPIFGAAETYAYFNIAFTGTWAVTNTTIDVGLFVAPASLAYAPTDGVYIRANNTGLFGVSNFNGTELTTGVFKKTTAQGGGDWVPTIGTFYDIIVTVGQNIVVFWMDQRDGNGYIRVGSIADSAGGGLPISVNSVPFTVRHAIGATAASGVMGAKIGTYTITQGGFQNTRSELITAATLTGGQQGQQGHTQGSTAFYANSLAPGAGNAMTNTTAALGSGLGGQFSALPTLTVNTDGIVCTYLNPIPTTAIPGRQLVVNGISISAVVTVALVGNATPVIYFYSIAYGHTSPALTTTDGINTKSPRRVPVGAQSFAAAAALGTIATPVYISLNRPLPVNPGENIALCAKNVGAVTTSGVITFLVTFDYGWVL